MDTSNGLDIKLSGKSAAEREDEGRTIHIRDDQGERLYFGTGDEKKPVTILVAGTYSATHRRAVEAQRDRMLRRRTIDGDQVEQGQLGVIAACMLAWDGMVADGRPVPLTKANAVALLDAAPWVREQVEAAMNDHQSFSSGRSTT